MPLHLVSIVIAVKNGEPYLKSTLDSLRATAYHPREINADIPRVASERPWPSCALSVASATEQTINCESSGVSEPYLTGADMLVDPENSGALAKAIGCLLENPDSAWRMGEAARNRAMKNFNFQRHLDA